MDYRLEFALNSFIDTPAMHGMNNDNAVAWYDKDDDLECIISLL